MEEIKCGQGEQMTEYSCIIGDRIPIISRFGFVLILTMYLSSSNPILKLWAFMNSWNMLFTNQNCDHGFKNVKVRMRDRVGQKHVIYTVYNYRI